MILKLEEEQISRILEVIVQEFKKHEEKINNLNVFPVPDGDTGTNMLLTLQSIQKEILKINNFDIKSLGKAITFGGLMGARGNSGVILSQILKGFFDVLVNVDKFNLHIIEDALESSRDLAYSSVQNPTEGTMLTIIKDIHLHVSKITQSDLDDISYSDFLDGVIDVTEKSLIRTTYLLQVLKDADVVDAGAQGVLEILKGFRKASVELGLITGNLIKEPSYVKSSVLAGNSQEVDFEVVSPKNFKDLKDININTDIKFIYCTELVVTGARIKTKRLREDIESYGDSAMVVGDENMVKIHVHTNFPNKVLKRAIREGELHEIQINNMIDQSKEAAGDRAGEKEAVKAAGLISVTNGDGIAEIFKSVGVDIIIKGGQTMNPSTYDIVKAIKSLDSDDIIIFPNNKNIILTANQAAKISKKNVKVIPTKSIPQGIIAALNYNKDLEFEENISNMEDESKKIKTGEVTEAVRDANLLVGEIKKGDIIGLYDGKISVISDNIVYTTLKLAEDMLEEGGSIITFYTGIDATEEDNEKIKADLQAKFKDVEIEFYNGGQPFYNYILSVEE
jgi:uncharacterized protein